MQYQSKNSEILARQLEAQEIVVVADLATDAGSSDLPTNVTIDNSTITATVVTLTVNEAVKKCFKATVRDRATGANTVIAAEPDLSVANKISITLDATGLTDVAITFVYAVA